MAVYTKFEKKDIEEILSNYSIGKLKSFKGIQEGIENTNYYLLVEEKKYILTIYEKRVNPEDLPFFSDLMSGLVSKNYKCPVPVINNKNVTISDYKGKKLMIVSFLEGRAKQVLTPNDCKQVGTEVARMHEITKDFKIKRSNNLSVKSWRNLFNSIKDQ
jgi:homoserine kinase type II